MCNRRKKNKKAACPLFRRFQPHDAEFCYDTRRSAYVREFSGELTAQEIATAMNAYSPADYAHMADEMPFFMVELHNKRVGFFTLKHVDTRTAEIPLIYIGLDNIGTGIGSACIAFVEKWISENWKDVTSLIVDTIIPQYNSKFYEKVGFTPDKQVFCEFGGIKVTALRLEKKLNVITQKR
jgi:GNAT superfamily N-acetyltransferase